MIDYKPFINNHGSKCSKLLLPVSSAQMICRSSSSLKNSTFSESQCRDTYCSNRFAGMVKCLRDGIKKSVPFLYLLFGP